MLELAKLAQFDPLFARYCQTMLTMGFDGVATLAHTE
jgi:hypothetical protein